ncbi:MAG: endonuclease/exonuclease/phosphatase family protein, partial [Bacteriovoracaceae bacterium]
MKFVAIGFLLIFSSAFGKSFTLMSYNVENLFDTIHDPGKEDYTYLPLKVKNASQDIQDYCNSITNDYYRKACLETDWSEDILSKKLANLAKVISSFDKGKGADILVLQEVENKSVLISLVKEKLKGLGYDHISLIEGPDSRGIDAAIVSKFPIVKEKLHLVDLDGVAKETRGILQADIQIGPNLVSVFSNHWPSQANPSEARYIAAQTLLSAALQSNAQAVIAAGDFNSIDKDHPHGINLVIKPEFYLAREEAQNRGFQVFAGSHWYRGEWGTLDKILILKNTKSSVVPKYSSFQVYKPAWLLTEREWTDYDT